MLVLSRKADQQIQIGPNITITILRIKGLAVQIGIDAPQDVRVMRTELIERTSTDDPESSPKEVENKQRQPREAAGRSQHHPGESYRALSNGPSAASPRCRVPRLRLTTPEHHPMRGGPASAADGLTSIAVNGAFTT